MTVKRLRYLFTRVKLNSLLCLLISWSIISCQATSPFPRFDENKAFQHLERQVRFGPRNPGSPGHGLTRDYLLTQLKSYTDRVEFQDFNFKDGEIKYTLTNIIGAFGEERISNARTSYILGAHWDTRPWADQDSNSDNHTKPIPGANDGASGVAVLLEMARLFAQQKPNRKVILVFFDGEDLGRSYKPGEEMNNNWLLGSKYFARHIGPYKADYGIVLDMIGDKDLDIEMEKLSMERAPELMDKVWKIADKLGYKAFHREPGANIFDDHWSLNFLAGIKSIDLIDFDYPYWHTLEDTPDKCSPQSLKVIGDVLVHLIYDA
jgi:hypothetical protein